MCVAPPALAQQMAPPVRSIDIPSMSLSRALDIIAHRTGTPVDFQKAEIGRATSHPVSHAQSADEALQQATSGTGFMVRQAANGGFSIVKADNGSQVSHDVVVIAHRDEAETSVLVRQASTSNHLGEALRDVPRNTQIISARTIAEQQSLTLNDVLRNAGGVTTLPANSQGGATYSVRGFSSGGLVNGVPSSGDFGVTIGSSQPIANIERVEVLKGPDALLAGANNLGGNINVVTKRPSADPLLAATFDTGSYGLVRVTGDVNGPISPDKTLSARLITSVERTQTDYGGYRGDEDDFIAPSIRFKNRRSDFILSFTDERSLTPLDAYTIYNPANNTLLNVPNGRYLFTPDQYSRVDDKRIYLDMTQEIGDHVTLVARGQHEDISLLFHDYTYAGINKAGLPGYYAIGSAQKGNSNAIDTYARIKENLSVFKFTGNLGYEYSDGSALYSNPPSQQTVRLPNIFDTTTPVPPLLTPNVPNILTNYTQQGAVVQGLVEFWKLHLTAGVRRTWYDSTSYLYFANKPGTPDPAKATTPNYGAVLDVTSNFSVYGNYVEGFQPTGTNTTYQGDRLPNIQSVNKEVGGKLDLFNKRALINLSYFWLQQDNVLLADPLHPGFFTATGGQLGKGVDFNVAGALLPGWTVQSSVTHTDYERTHVTPTAQVVAGQPADKYSFYSTYRWRATEQLRLGVGAGLYGQSSSWASIIRQYRVPASQQVDVNLFGQIKGLTLNLGVRNIFDRRNYGPTSTVQYIPISEPRNWRLTLGYRF